MGSRGGDTFRKRNTTDYYNQNSSRALKQQIERSPSSKRSKTIKQQNVEVLENSESKVKQSKT